MRRRTVICLAIFLLAGCGQLKELPTDPGSGSEPPDPSATFTRVQNEIFSPTCAAIGCHDRLGRQQGMILAAGSAYANTVDVPSTEMPSLVRVRPGEPENSYLYRKIRGVGITGERMPLGGPYLSDAQIRLVRDWIRRGAPND